MLVRAYRADTMERHCRSLGCLEDEAKFGKKEDEMEDSDPALLL